MSAAKAGDTVAIHYTGKLQDGTIFDTSQQRGPASFRLGEGRVIPGFEKAVLGMSPGDTKVATIPPDEAYGPRQDEMVITLPRQEIPPTIEPKVGDKLQMTKPDGEALSVTVTELSDDSVTLDANHPLAGEDLTFEIELVEIQNA